MSVFERSATVAYDGKNFSILSVENISSSQATQISVDDFRVAYETAFRSSGSNSSDDAIQTDALLYAFGWALRLYQDEFPDDTQSATKILEGFLAVPIQFSTTLWQYLNSTKPLGLTFPIPSELSTTASGNQSIYRVLAESPWTIYLFMAATAGSVSWVIGQVLFLRIMRRDMPDTSPFPEIDISSKPGRLPNVQPQTRPISERAIDDSNEYYRSLLRNRHLNNNVTIVNIKDQRIRVLRPDSETGFVIDIGNTEDIKGNWVQKSRDIGME